MPFTLTMPKLSPTMEVGTIVRWCKKEGDKVAMGDVILEIATDKATVEHTALEAGYLRKILLAVGKSGEVNQPIAIFTQTKDESIEGYKVVDVAIKPLEERETSQDLTLDSVPEEKTVAMKKIPGGIFAPELPLKNYRWTTPSDTVLASPLAKKLAYEKGIDLSTIQGSGPGNRIVAKDLSLGQPAVAATFGRRESPKVPSGTFEEEPLSPMEQVIANRLYASKSFIPHFYLVTEIMAEKLWDFREQLKNLGHKISVNDCIIRACALALREHPEINSGFDLEKQMVIRFKTVDISIAVSVDGGLLTPIIRYADFKNLGAISSEAKQLFQKAKTGELQREDYMGGSFTISNLGMFGISEFMAIINPPQAAILAVGAIEDRCVVCNNAVVPGKTIKLTLSADHRVIDGARGAEFLKTLRKYLENPVVLAM
jgi:pyruvate dehydrogenase E2 component (dihydrolipoamide acetyltransferase)